MYERKKIKREGGLLSIVYVCMCVYIRDKTVSQPLHDRYGTERERLLRHNLWEEKKKKGERERGLSLDPGQQMLLHRYTQREGRPTGSK